MIEAEKARYPIALMCRILGVSRSGLYAWRRRSRVSKREREAEELTTEIRRVHAASRGTYGSPRVHRQLRREGIHINHKRVERLMRRAGLAGRIRRRFRTTTDSRSRPAGRTQHPGSKFRRPGGGSGVGG